LRFYPRIVALRAWDAAMLHGQACISQHFLIIFLSLAFFKFSGSLWTTFSGGSISGKQCHARAGKKRAFVRAFSPFRDERTKLFFSYPKTVIAVDFLGKVNSIKDSCSRDFYVPRSMHYRRGTVVFIRDD
jgi:hypothetical protein